MRVRVHLPIWPYIVKSEGQTNGHPKTIKKNEKMVSLFDFQNLVQFLSIKTQSSGKSSSLKQIIVLLVFLKYYFSRFIYLYK